MLLLLGRVFLCIKRRNLLLKRLPGNNKICKPSLISCSCLHNNLWIKKIKKLTTNYPHFIYFPMQKSLKISPSKSSGYLTPRNSSKEDLTSLRSSAATSTSRSLDIFSIQALRSNKALLNKSRCLSLITNVC